jgi:very-short-patch-repair endonuclease|nr:MAG TPA: restriction enzyme [Caudoviricetes sp.]
MVKLKYEDVYDYFLKNDTLLLSDKYVNNNKVLKLLCLNCGNIFEKSLNKFKEGQSCPICKKNNKNKNTFLYIKYYMSQYGYIIESNEYCDAHEKLKLICPDGHHIEMNWNNFKNGKRCKECDNKKRRLTTKEVYERMKKEGHELLSEYKNSKTELQIKCPNGHIYPQTYDYFVNNIRCPICKEKEIKNKEQHKYKWVKNTINSVGYELLTKNYTNNRQPLDIKCDKGHVYTSNFDNFQQGHRCIICNSSNGNKKVENILKKLKINYIVEYKFENCKFKRQLPFDFYLPDYNLCIEYDGVQHFEIVKHFGGFDDFITRKIKDTIKNVYCNENNIKLIRIPYWDFDNIENIIINKLKINKHE